MICRIRRLRNDRSGASRVTVVLAVLIVIAAGFAAVPLVRHYLNESARLDCQAALDAAHRQLAADYMLSMTKGTPSADDVLDTVSYSMYNKGELCPAGGTIYVVDVEVGADEGLPYRLVCGLHDSDTKLCTRLNASNVFSQVRKAVQDAQSEGNAYPESVTVKLHSKELTAYLVDKSTNILRGTSTTNGVEGIVAYYSIVGHSDFGANSGMEEGEIWYFSYADENHCANWNYRDGWEGDSLE